MDRQKLSTHSSCAAKNAPLVGVLLALALVSCRSVDNVQVDLLERELRRQETYIYELEDYLLEYSEKLNQCRAKHAAKCSQDSVASPSATPRSTHGRTDIPEPELVKDPPKSKNKKPLGSSRSAGTPPKIIPPPVADRQHEPLNELDGPKPSDESSTNELPDGLEEASPAPSDYASDGPAKEAGSDEEASAKASGSESPVPDEADDVHESPSSGEFETLPQPSPTPQPAPTSLENWEPDALEIGWQSDDEAIRGAREANPSVGQTVPTLVETNALRPQRKRPAVLIPDAAKYIEDDSDSQQAIYEVENATDASVTQASAASLSPLADDNDETLPQEEPISSNSPAETNVVDDSYDEHRTAHSLAIRRVLANNAQSSEPEALMVVVEALSARQEPLEPQGQISLMIMTSDAPGSLERVERWDFTSDEAASAWQSTSLGDGFHLQLPLRAEGLPRDPFELWARLVLKSGDKLLTKLPIDAASLPTLDDGLAAADASTHSRTSDGDAPDDSSRTIAEPLPSLRIAEPRTQDAASQDANSPSVGRLADASSRRSNAHSPTLSNRSQAEITSTTKSEWRTATSPLPTPSRNSTSARLGNSSTSSPTGSWSSSSQPLPASIGVRRESPILGGDIAKPRAASAKPAPRWQPFR